MPLFIIINPACGDKSAPSFFVNHVFPKLDAHNITVDHVLHTNSPDHAQTFLREYISAKSEFADDNGITVILGSGDGTLHEITESIRPYTLQHEQLRINFVLIPCGTANALYHSLFPDSIDNPDTQSQKQTNDDADVSKKLRSLEAFLSRKELKTISLAVTTIVAQDATEVSTSTAAVVTSTALHACILRDSESLRDEYPGVERFKVAAQKNSTLWYHARVKLYPAQSTGKVEMYDPESHSFTTLEPPHGSTSVDLEGPFVYFTATTGVDRLEPTFRILPLMRSLPPSSPSCDIAIVRPLRCSAIAQDDDDSRAAFGATTWKVLYGAYEDGSHVRHRYDANGGITVEGHGPTVVEYVRCGGWEWIPMEGDQNAHVLCCDGGITSIKPGGTASCVVDTKGRFRVYV